ncbi:predicted protein [Uncinocarpus reesii 1704]|uniref:Zn(2)-C6 fungal-type domain-containing protein n=1 Tax=Uncinocarpus reesii (strain UAMH 1704) TaxID=336963 RepID=C4JVA6_UNCRE|nr:uncharacterized protein UREG_06498 [Uncinocarpus reesii 1704]EEP81633.1 predicted protein [Uncinocarpus reesii 1704]
MSEVQTSGNWPWLMLSSPTIFLHTNSPGYGWFSAHLFMLDVECWLNILNISSSANKRLSLFPSTRTQAAPMEFPTCPRSHDIVSLPRTQRALKVLGPWKIELAESCPLPQLAEDEILVQVRCVAVNPVDVKTLDLAPNVGTTAGCEFAGDIVHVGPSVKNMRLKKGVAVFGVIQGNHFDRPDNGAWADFVAVASDLVYLLPPHFSYQEGASMGAALPTVGMALYYSWGLPLPYRQRQGFDAEIKDREIYEKGGITAAAGMDVGLAAQTGQKPSGSRPYVLVYGGSTTCGAMALQVLRLSGLAPICTCSPKNFGLVKRLGAEAAFDYRSPSCGDDIRRYTEDSLGYVLDCITDLSSMKICYAAMGRRGGKYMGLNPVPLRGHTRRDIQPDYILVYTMFGQAVTAPKPFGRPIRPKDRAFGERWYQGSQQLVDVPGTIVAHPRDEGPEGLKGVVDGLERMRSGGVSAVKLVYQLRLMSAHLQDFPSTSANAVFINISLLAIRISAARVPTSNTPNPAGSPNRQRLCRREMRAQGGQGGQSRKRRRQAVVCTECRRRKIACNRSIPCAQCIQSNSICTYYNSYYSYAGKGNAAVAQDGGSKDHPLPPSITPQPIYPLGSGLQLPPLPYSYQNDLHGAAEIGSLPATTVSAGAGVQSSCTISNPAPLSLPYDLDTTTDMVLPDVSAEEILSLNAVVGLTDRVATNAMQLAAVCSQEPSRIVFQKSRLYPQSHWMTFFQGYEPHNLFESINNTVFRGEGHPGLQKCKQLAKALKAKSGPDPQLLLRPLREFIPPKEISDRLVKLYLRTFESVLRILHIPTFEREYAQYWEAPRAADESIVLQILLVIAIGTCFCQDALSSDDVDGLPTLHDQATQWIHAAHLKLTAPYRKKHLNLRGVQTQCLLVLALLTNTNAIGGDLAWVTTSSLIQCGLAIGLHIAPSRISTTPLEAEVRRRLWSTMLELAVQAALDSGLPPVISAETLDSYEQPGANEKPADSAANGDIHTELNAMRAVEVITDPSENRRTLGRYRSDLSYDAARSMGAELTAALRKTSELIDSCNRHLVRRVSTATPRRLVTSRIILVEAGASPSTIRASRRRSVSTRKQQADQVVADAARQALDGCYNVLKARLQRLTLEKSRGPSSDLPAKHMAEANDLPSGDAEKDDGIQGLVAVPEREQASDTGQLLDDCSDVWSVSAWENEMTF